MLKSLATDMSETAFSNKDYTDDKLLQQIIQFEDLLIQVSIELNDPESNKKPKDESAVKGKKNKTKIKKTAKKLIKKVTSKKKAPKDHLREMYVLFRKGYESLEKKSSVNAKKVLIQINEMYKGLASFEKEQFDEEIIELQKEINELEGKFEREAEKDLSNLYKLFASAYEALEESKVERALSIIGEIERLSQNYSPTEVEQFKIEIEELRAEVRNIHAENEKEDLDKIKVEPEPESKIQDKKDVSKQESSVEESKKIVSTEKTPDTTGIVKEEKLKTGGEPKVFGKEPEDKTKPDIETKSSPKPVSKEKLKEELKQELKKELKEELKVREDPKRDIESEKVDKESESGLITLGKEDKKVDDLHLEAVKKDGDHFITSKPTEEIKDTGAKIASETKKVSVSVSNTNEHEDVKVEKVKDTEQIKKPKTQEDLDAMIHAAKQLLQSGNYVEAKSYYDEAMKFKSKLSLQSRTKRKIDYELMGIGVDLKLSGLA